MKSSSLVAATGKQQAQFARKRDHPQFDGMSRSETVSVRWKSPNSPTDSTISKSLSDIWEFESKHNAPDIADETTLKSEKPSFDEEDNNIAVIDKPIEDEFQAVLPQSAASFYAQKFQKNDASVLAVCEGVDSLNRYLKDRKDDIKAGVPGRYLHAVIGSDVAGVGSFISTIMYAFFLSKTQKNSLFCTVPIINMKRAELSTRSELKWLLRSCRVDESSLVFIDEVELTYFDQYGNLKIVLVNGNKLPAKQEGLKEAVVEIFFCKEIDTQYTMVEEVTMAEDCSCCTLLTEQFLEASPEILAGQGFSRLLLAGILLDTENLTTAACTSKDKYTATLLINGAGRFGSNGLYQLLKHKLHDISELNVRDILRREFKKWTRVAGKPNVVGSRLTISHIGMSSIGISVTELLNHEDSAADEISLFQESENLRLFMIVSGYYDKQKNFKREILVSTNTAELMRSFLHFFDTNGTHLPLKALDQLGLNEEFRAFEIDNRLTSRRSIERLLEEFGKSSRHRI